MAKLFELVQKPTNLDAGYTMESVFHGPISRGTYKEYRESFTIGRGGDKLVYVYMWTAVNQTSCRHIIDVYFDTITKEQKFVFAKIRYEFGCDGTLKLKTTNLLPHNNFIVGSMCVCWIPMKNRAVVFIHDDLLKVIVWSKAEINKRGIQLTRDQSHDKASFTFFSLIEK